ncbi:uncharacterized protein LOC105280666 [Ooceraea biroi]|uniref:uncharacterized protein LOC105280666 n=1 Tax=Ooceraea biroi TaxID=2015173 RepID=UPI0005BA8B01|nr:uncharacterized protein LOC105280666 [Ooceraea biroi]
MELRKLAQHCDFGATLDETLCLRLVCGVQDERLQQKLLATTHLTLQIAQEKAVAHELAITESRDMRSIIPQKSEVRLVEQKDKSQKHRKEKTPVEVHKACYRCGKTNHPQSKCLFKDSICHACQKKGYIASAC